jgi:hypothetical protein
MLEVAQQFNAINLKYLEEQFTPTSDDLRQDYNPFHLNSFQYYQPILKLLFDINSQNYNSMQLNHRFHMADLKTVIDTTTCQLVDKPIFIKYSPLLDPIRYMIGRYDTDNDAIRTLPSIDGTNFDKLSDTNNASYTDGFFSLLSSKLMELHDFKHSVAYYGSFSAVQQKFKMNIADDYEYLNNSNFFMDHVNKLFRINRHRVSSMANHNSRGNRDKIIITSEDSVVLDASILDLSTIDIDLSPLEEVYADAGTGESDVANLSLTRTPPTSDEDDDDEEDDEDDDEEDAGADAPRTPPTSDDEYDTDDDEDENEDDEDEDEDDDEEGEDDDEEDVDNESRAEETNIFAYIDNFPVQMICLEKCEGTLDELFVNEEIDEKTGASALFQVIMTLLAYQTAFKFTHNDLHTNNIMYISTEIEFLYYKYNNVCYKVPTYGRIFKLIDFGRSIYTYNGKLFCSDSFATGGDAATQYNFEPYYNKKYPIIEPNYSFDLCRLGCSIIDFIVDDKPRDELQKTVHRWCMDDKKTSVLYKKNGDERYPDFKLYKMIAKTVHAHTPQNQLAFPFFSQFKSSVTDASCMDIDKIPSYA